MKIIKAVAKIDFLIAIYTIPLCVIALQFINIYAPEEVFENCWVYFCIINAIHWLLLVIINIVKVNFIKNHPQPKIVPIEISKEEMKEFLKKHEIKIDEDTKNNK